VQPDALLQVLVLTAEMMMMGTKGAYRLTCLKNCNCISWNKRCFQ